MDFFDIVMYHGSCPDGICAAWVFHQKNTTFIIPKTDTIYIPCYHNNQSVDFELIKNKKVVIADFSFSREIIEKMTELCSYLLILDHHVSAERILGDLPNTEKRKIIFDMERSGAQLAWDYNYSFVNQENCQNYYRPWFINYVADRDLWKHELIHSKEINEALNFYGYFDESDLHKFIRLNALGNFTKSEISKYASTGGTLLEYKRKQIEQLTKKAILATFKVPEDNEYTVLMVDCPYHLRSDAGNALSETGDCDFAVLWSYIFEKDEWSISLRGSSKSNLDLSKIAEKFGGGGHAKAAGFAIREKDGSNLKTYFTQKKN